ncbi:MAG: cysteine synthase A [Acetobacteraceae bacterium]|nr:cysteine synthase A [Acetobacteraceae bacterium]
MDRNRRVLGSILEAVGETPLVELSRVGGGSRARVLAKVEGLNPSGSIKARSALAMIEAAEREGRLRPGAIIVEPTSGNQGIGLAMVAAVKGYRARLVMPESMSAERRALISAYGAEVVLTPAGRDIQEAIEICIQEARRMAEEDPRVFLPQQFENPANPAVHRETTAREILDQVGGPIHAFVAGVGTGGTLTGVGEALKSAFPGVMVVAVEPTAAPLLSGGKMGTHIQQGIGDGVMPAVLNTKVIDRVITVEDADAAATARELARREGLLVGVSSGSNVWASLVVARELGPGRTVVTVLPDSGERYLSMGLFVGRG